MPIYLDCNATTPLKGEVADVIMKYMIEEYGNAGSRTHAYGAKAKSAVELARQKIADVVNAQKNEVIFTSGATESNNLSILGLADTLISKNKTHLITTAVEHKSILEPFFQMERKYGFEVSYIGSNGDGYISLQDIVSQVNDRTGLISCMQVNNETGVIYPIHDIACYLEENKLDIYFHTDAAQGYGKVLDQLRNKRIDLISVSAHKIYGPKGVGALIRRVRDYKKVPVNPLMYGGGQESSIRPGTLPVALIAGFGKASELALSSHNEWWEKCQKKKDELIASMEKLNPIIHGINTMPSSICFSIPGINSEAAIVALKDIISFSNGSACTSRNYTTSHVLKAMNVSDEIVRGAMRMSWCEDTPEIPWSKVVDCLEGLII